MKNESKKETGNDSIEMVEIDDIFGFKNYKNVTRLIELSKFDAAEKEIEKLLKKNPEDYTALILKGFSYQSRGKIGSAVKLYESAIKINPEDPRGHSLLGVILSNGLDEEKGIKELRKAVELAPYDAEYKAGLANHLYLTNNKKDKEDARRLAKEALQQSPSNTHVKKVYHIIFEDEATSKKIIKDLVREDPNDAESLNLLAVKYLEEGQYEKACKTFKNALSIDPTEDMLKHNYALSLKARMLWYRPYYLFSKLAHKLGTIKFYVIYFIIVFGIISIMPLFAPIILLFVIYTWIADPIANLIVRRKMKND